MKAIVQHKYGSPDELELKEIARPALADDGVLVRVRAASVNAYDWHLVTGRPYLVHLMAGLRKPKSSAVGVDLAGEVVAVGTSVTQFKPGDEVFGGCAGAFAEYACGTERNFVPKPARLTFGQAAAIPMAGRTALQGLRDEGRIRPGQKVLINGASGGVGTFAVQIAKALGADVTAVCGTRSVDLVRSLGADRIVDRAREDFTRGDQRYDLILDVAGDRSAWRCRRVLRADGTLVVVGGPDGRWLGPLTHMLKALVLSRFVSQKMGGMMAKGSKADLVVLNELIEAGKVTPVVDRTYRLSEAGEAIRYVEERRAQGKVVITP